MARGDAIGKLETELLDAAADGDWDQLVSAREGLVGALLEAVEKSDADVLRRVEAALIEAHRILVLKHGLSRKSVEAMEAWGLFAEAHTAAIAAKRAPPAAEKLTKRLLRVRDAILVYLAETPARRSSNCDIARGINAAEETVSRVLRAMRREGLIDWWPASRFTMNQLSEAGVQAAKLVRKDPPSPQPAIPMGDVAADWDNNVVLLNKRVMENDTKLRKTPAYQPIAAIERP